MGGKINREKLDGIILPTDLSKALDSLFLKLESDKRGKVDIDA